MDANESVREAERILHAAGWQSAPGWQGYTHGQCVGGIAPDGTLYVKSLDMVKPGDPRYGPDTPDEHHEAAAWLVEHAKQRAPKDDAPAAVDTMMLAEEPEAVESLGDESNGETSEASDSGSGVLGGSEDALRDPPELDGSESDVASGGEPSPLQAENDPIDADFTIEDLGGLEAEDTELPALDAPLPEDFAPDEIKPQEEGGGAFIFGDNLDQMRTAAIGRVIRYANGIMPRWMPEDDARLATLRNFAMGVSEKRWDDNPANQSELNALETTIRRINEIKNARDDKVTFLEGASREEIEDFAVEAGWP